MDLAYRIRPAIREDLAEIVALDRATKYLPHWTAADYAVALHAEERGRPVSGVGRCLFVAERTGLIVGFAVGRIVGPAQEVFAELESIGVADAARRLGIGRALCLAVFDWATRQGAREIELEVRSRSDGPIAMYRGLGFVTVGQRARYYREPSDDAILMRLELTQPDPRSDHSTLLDL